MRLAQAKQIKHIAAMHLFARSMALILAAASLGSCASLAYYNRLPANQKLLFAPQAERDAGFSAMDRYGPVKTIAAGGAARPLPDGPPLALSVPVEGFIARQRMSGVIVLQDGKVRLERYALGLDRNGRWTSFSMAKSITSALVGAALRDGSIRSLDDKVTDYVPALAGSAYHDVTVRQVLTMTSGVSWNEDYGDPNSDVARFIVQQPGPAGSATVAYLRTIPRVDPPGSRWNYNTGETNLAGVLVASATGKSLADYLSEKIWRPYGMERDAIWYLDSGGAEIGGCCISASLRDYARFGQFMLDGAQIDGQPVFADGYHAAATRIQHPFGTGQSGYGYLWWTRADGSYQARGIFGQSILIEPSRKLVIVILGNWPRATGRAQSVDRTAFIRTVIEAVDAK